MSIDRHLLDAENQDRTSHERLHSLWKLLTSIEEDLMGDIIADLEGDERFSSFGEFNRMFYNALERGERTWGKDG